MKKLLLSSVAMAGASALATSAFAVPLQSMTEDGTPVLTASMTAQFEGGFVSRDDKLDDNANQRDGGFVNGRFGEIYFNGEMTADNGLVYGAKIHFMTTDFQDTTNTNGYPGREYIYLKGGWGSMELGNWPGADSLMNLTPTPQTYKGIGGLDFAYHSYASRPDNAIANGNNPYWFEQSAKATYLTPAVGGFQAGVSYTPSAVGFWSKHCGPTVRGATDPKGTKVNLAEGEITTEVETALGCSVGYNDVVGVGAKWGGDFGGTTLGLSAVGATSDDDTDSSGMVTGQGLGYYEIAGRLGFGGFVFAGAYWDFGDGGAKPNVEQDYTGWALNASYSFGPYGVELQYAHAERDQMPSGGMMTQSHFDGWAAAVGYSLAPGLKWYGEVVGNTNELKGFDNDGEYSSTVFLSGLLLSF